ncbi:MAG: Pr6Pr family membrane protein [Pseudomonadota bacterium]|nr:Pr6Pr family membrane protein [Pseudomonadota bacterium]
MGAGRIVAAIAALVGWAGLLLQYVIFAERVGLGLATWRFVGFFTVLSNIGIACIATAIALGREGRLAGSRARLMGLTAIVTVGFVYSLLLRSQWNPTGLQKLVDAALHDWTPILFAILWALTPHGELKWSDMKWALTPPALYLAYAMTRGAFDGWYPYYFLNPTLQTGAELAVSIVGTLAVFAIIAGSGIAIDQRLAARREGAEKVY